MEKVLAVNNQKRMAASTSRSKGRKTTKKPINYLPKKKVIKVDNKTIKFKQEIVALTARNIVN